MKKTKFNLMLLLLFISTYLMSANIQYKINGKTDLTCNGQQVMLFQFQGEDVLHVDTTIIKNGEFVFEGKADTLHFAIITSGNYPHKVRSTRLMLENGVINVYLDTISKIGGTKLNDIYQPFLAEYNSRYYKINKLNDLMQSDRIAKVKNDTIYRDSWMKLFALEKEFLINNITNSLGIILFKEKYEHMNWYTFEEVYASSDDQIKNDPEIKKYVRWREKQKTNDIERDKKMLELTGKKYTDFVFMTDTGEKVKLSDYIGKSKYILLDFWASWCGPCMQEQPFIKKVYNNYKNKGLNILGISLDSNEGAWKIGIKKTLSNWTQLCDLKAGDSGIKDAYRFNGIPHTVLIDQNGTIVVSGLRGVLLENYIAALFKNEK